MNKDTIAVATGLVILVSILISAGAYFVKAGKILSRMVELLEKIARSYGDRQPGIISDDTDEPIYLHT